MARSRPAIAQFQTTLVEILAGKGPNFTEDDVKQILGPAGIDGRAGNRTTAAMNAFQEAFGVPVSELDPTPATITAMHRLTPANPPPSFEVLLAEWREYKAERRQEEEAAAADGQPPPVEEPTDLYYKPPEEKGWPWWAWVSLVVGIGVVVVGAGVGIWYFTTKRKKSYSKPAGGYGEASGFGDPEKVFENYGTCPTDDSPTQFIWGG